MERTSDQASACPSCGQPATDGQLRGQQQPVDRPLIGKLLGQNYRVLKPIGSGAMGQVYVVEHIALKKRFAAKLLTADLARHPEAVARFETEAHAASQLDHENIVSIIDYGKTDDGCVFIIMELLRGQTLQARMDEGQVSGEEIIEIVIQVCRALGEAHAAGIVHRDMKPDNIFLAQRTGGRPQVKVLDFGIAKARESSVRGGRITKRGQLLGSPEYMSPEASRGDEVDARADIYAVGVLLYELLCGEVPFRHENYLKVLKMHGAQPPRPPRELVPDLPEAVERLILRALEKDPRRRQASIQELELELIAALPELGQRSLMRIAAPTGGGQWLANSPQSMLFVNGPTLPMPEESGNVHDRPRRGSIITTLVTRPGGRRGLPVPRPRGRRGLPVPLWSCALLVATTAGFLLLSRFPDAGRRPVMSREQGMGTDPVAEVVSEAAPAAKTTAADPSAAVDAVAAVARSGGEARPEQIRLRVNSSPAGAVATLDGQRLGRTPIDTWVAASQAEAALELDLRGFKTASRAIRLDRDGEIHVSLQRDMRRSNSSSRKAFGSSGTGRSASDPGKGDDSDERDRTRADVNIKEGR